MRVHCKKSCNTCSAEAAAAWRRARDDQTATEIEGFRQRMKADTQMTQDEVKLWEAWGVRKWGARAAGWQ